MKPATDFALARIIAVSVLAHLALVAARLTASLYALAHHVSTFTIGVILALFSLVPMLIAMPAGRWIDTAGPWHPTRTGLLLILAGVFLPAAFPYERADVAPLMVGAALVGSGCMLAMLAVQHVVGERTPAAGRQAAFSWLALGASISGFAGPVASGALIDGLGYRATFALLVVEGLVALAVLHANRGLLPAHRHASAPPAPRHPLELLGHAPLRQVMMATALIAMSWDLQTFAIPLLGTQEGLSAARIGTIMGSFALATFAIRLAMPRLSQRYREWQVLGGTLAVTAGCFVLFPFLHHFAALAAAAFVLGLGLGAAQPNIMSLLHLRTPPGRVGEALGLRSTLINSSQVVLPLVFGAFGAVLGIGAMFWSMALVLAAGGALLERAGRAAR